jgi:hypothetical protein
MGRVDGQVKVRGFRIELGEVEAALAGHEGVRQAVVVVREEGGEKRLVAYVVATEGEQAGTGIDSRGHSHEGAGESDNGHATGVSEAELRHYLRTRLPDYMVPQRLLLLDSLPLTPNGKVDTRALPAPGQAVAEAGTHYVAPRGAVEEVMAGIWGEVLGAGRVGVSDNFFDLGGHSLLATRVVSWVRKVFKVEAGLRLLFEEPTVAGFVGAVREEAGEQGWVRMERAAQLLLSLSGGSESGAGERGTGEGEGGRVAEGAVAVEDEGGRMRAEMKGRVEA